METPHKIPIIETTLKQVKNIKIGENISIIKQNQQLTDKGCHNCAHHYRNGKICASEVICVSGSQWKIISAFEQSQQEETDNSHKLKNLDEMLKKDSWYEGRFGVNISQIKAKEIAIKFASQQTASKDKHIEELKAEVERLQKKITTPTETEMECEKVINANKITHEEHRFGFCLGFELCYEWITKTGQYYKRSAK